MRGEDSVESFTGHSLKVGANVALEAAGYTEEQRNAIIGWKQSKSSMARLYSRPLLLAAVNAQKAMLADMAVYAIAPKRKQASQKSKTVRF